MQAYRDSSLTPSERAADLLGRMTVTEKIGQVNQKLYGFACYERNGDELALTQEFRNEADRYGGIGVLYGLYRADPWSGKDHRSGLKGRLAPQAYNLAQQYVLEHSRLGIPMLMSGECPHGHQALDGYLLPVNLAAGATFNPELAKRAAAVCAAQLKEMGVNLALVSMLDILRDPRWGRSEECFGEDPWHASVFAEAVTKGMQEQGAAVVAKHFCAQGETTGGVNASAARIGERELREIHLPAAKACCAAGVKGVMAAYNEIDGIFCHANRHLLRDILRGEFGFDGVIMADGVAIDRLDGMTGDNVRSAAAAMHAGVDIGLWDEAYSKLDEAIERGLISAEELDEAVFRVLKLKFEQGLFDNPYLPEDADGTGYTVEKYPEALTMARESVILLKNEGTGNRDAVLPLPTGRKIAVIGPNADDLYSQLGDYTPPIEEGTGITVRKGVCDLAAETGSTVLYCSGDNLEEAVRTAEACDFAVLVLGGSSSRFQGAKFDKNGAAVTEGSGEKGADEGVTEDRMIMDCGEGMDCAELTLSGNQQELFGAVKKTGTPVVTVLIQGRPYAVPEIAARTDALLCSFYPGIMGGRAIAEILFGKISPSGRLPVSVPRHAGQIPVYYNYKSSYRGMNYCDEKNGALYSFGEGFGYGNLRYGGFVLEQGSTSIKEFDGIRISGTIRNDSGIDDYAVPQVYIRAVSASTVRRVRELKAFDKIRVPAGRESTFSLALAPESFSLWNDRMEQVTEPGEIEITVTDSGTELWRTAITLT